MSGYFRSGIGRILRSLFNVLVFLAVCVLVLVLLSEDFAGEVSLLTTGGGISADALAARVGENVSIQLVYAGPDDFAATCASELKEKLETNPSLTVSVCADDETWEDTADLTVFLGHTLQNSESYRSAFLKLGENGLEITHSENEKGETDKLFITAFTEERLREGIDKFSSYFLSVNRLYKTFSSLYIYEKGKTSFDMPEKLILDGSDYSIFALSYPGIDSYSLAALEGLVKELSPDLVLFNGGCDFRSERAELAAGWESILKAVKPYTSGLSLYLDAADLDSRDSLLSADLFDAIFGTDPVYGAESRFVMIQSPDGTPLAFVFYPSADGDAAEDLKYMSTLLNYASRAVRQEIPSIVIMPSVPASVKKELTQAASAESTALFINEDMGSSDTYSESLYAGARLLGIENFVFCAGYTNAGTCVLSDGTQAGLCASMDFTSPGLGGRFALDNSLRGGLYIDFDFSSEATETVKFRFIYASDYGLTVKNVG